MLRKKGLFHEKKQNKKADSEKKGQISRPLLLEYIDCRWFIDFLLQEVTQLSANREKFVSAIRFATFEADHFRTPCGARCFLCVSATSTPWQSESGES